MSHDECEETNALSVCPSCVEQLEDSGENRVTEAAGNLEVFRGCQMCALT